MYQCNIITAYKITLEKASNGVPALPGCVTQGETLEEAIAMAKDAIRLHVETLMAYGEPVPEEREHPQAIIIHVAA